MKQILFLLAFLFAWPGVALADCNGAQNCGDMFTISAGVDDSSISGSVCTNGENHLTAGCAGNTARSLQTVPTGYDYIPTRLWVQTLDGLGATEDCTVDIVCVDIATDAIVAHTGSIEIGPGSNVVNTGDFDTVAVTGGSCSGGDALMFRIAQDGTCSVLQVVNFSMSVTRSRNAN